MDIPFQRVGAISNAHVGNAFEQLAQDFFLQQGLQLQRRLSVDIGVGPHKKAHAFDLGSHEHRVLVECKSHCWTTGNNIPIAKLTVWNEAMYYFHVAPPEFRKIMFVLKSLRRGDGESLARYYLRICGHLVPGGVEFWEYDASTGGAERIGT